MTEVVTKKEELEEEKIKKIVKKMVQSNHSKSTTLLKQKIKRHLFSNGYHSALVEKVLASTKFESDQDIKEKEYEKLKRKLERKYQGEELERQIKNKLYQRGFTNL